MSDVVPVRGDIWHANFGQPMGHEAGFDRPVIVISNGRFNAHGLVSVCPITRTEKTYPTRIQISPGTSGLDVVSYIQVEQVRTISTQRLFKHRGRAHVAHLRDIERILRLMFEIR
jgi:mRNA interferase MazF